MLILITYDVCTLTREGRKRLNKVAKLCCNYGQRVQNSVFECDLNSSLYVAIKNKLLKIINSNEDSIRFYNLGNNYNARIEEFGAKKALDPEDVLIF